MIGLAKVGITETVLRDAHQSLIATRMTTEEMLPVLEQLDDIGFRSLECWGGATFDSCLRFLGEDPWERLRTLEKAYAQDPAADAVPGPEYAGLPALRRRCCGIFRAEICGQRYRRHPDFRRAQ